MIEKKEIGIFLSHSSEEFNEVRHQLIILKI